MVFWVEKPHSFATHDGKCEVVSMPKAVEEAVCPSVNSDALS